MCETIEVISASVKWWKMLLYSRWNVGTMIASCKSVFRPHCRNSYRRPIATCVVACSVGLSVGLSRPYEYWKTAEPIEVLFGMWTRVGPRKHVLDEGPDPHTRTGNFVGEKGPAWYTQSDSAGGSTGTVRMTIGVYYMGCTLAQSDEYDWTVRVRRRCGLFVKWLRRPLVIIIIIIILILNK